jgi:hypothetical protein
MRLHGAKRCPAMIQRVMDQDIYQGSGNVQLGSDGAMCMAIEPMEFESTSRSFRKFG